MTEEAKEARRAYKREWQRKNPDKVRAYQEKHWEKVAAQKNAERVARIQENFHPHEERKPLFH